MTTEFWRRWLLLAAGLVSVYAVGLVVAGSTASRLFDLLGFGPRAVVPEGEARSYVLFTYAVLGAVLTGWMLLIMGIAAGPLRDHQPWAWPTLVVSLGTWFVLDTGISLVLGFLPHAVFNLGFAAALCLPLAGWRHASRHESSRQKSCR